MTSRDVVPPALRIRLATLFATVALVGCASPSGSPGSPIGGSTPPSEGAPGDWQVLFDGAAVTGLRGYGAAVLGLPSSWAIADGRLRTIAGAGTDLATVDTFEDFEVEFTWAVTPGGNSGVLYRVTETADPAWTTGPEYQVLDDAGHPDGRVPATSAGALYDLIPPGPAKPLAPIGEDNESRIVVRAGRVEHWLNGELVVEYDWRSDEVLGLIAASKFRDLPGFMAADAGRVVVQHHGEEVSFGPIRIRRL